MRQAASLLAGAQRPVILAGRGSRDPGAWQRRVALAEAIGARVVTDRKSGATFPTDHPLHVTGTASIVDADVILSLDWVDLAGTLRTAHDSLYDKRAREQLSVSLQIAPSLRIEGAQ